MRPFVRIIRPVIGNTRLILAAWLFAGCSSENPSPTIGKPPPPPTTAAVTASPAAAPAPKVNAIRIRAGTSQAFTDSSGNAWLADQGFADGDTIERPGLAIANTKDPAIYQAERYSMTGFTWPLPNGKYTVKLHFAETYEDITAVGQRIFTFNVQGREFKNFDVFAKTGGDLRAYVETIPVEIADGKLHITFTPQVQNPQINGIEILPGW